MAPIRDCADLEKLRLDMNEHLYPAYEMYHIGNFYKNDNPIARRSNPATDAKTDS